MKLFTILFALQFFAQKMSNKSVWWETDNYAASLTIVSERNNTGIPNLLSTQSHETSKNIQKSKHARGTLLELSFILLIFIILCFKGIEQLHSWFWSIYPPNQCFELGKIQSS